jgi:hypothetical protein
MKAILFFLPGLFSCFFLQAQTYHSFIHELALWEEYEATDFCDPGNQCVEYYETIWIMSGDTVVGNLAYKKLYFEVVDYHMIAGWDCMPASPFWSDGVFWKEYLFGLIREDSAHRVFIVANPDVKPPVICSVADFAEEKILYDFNL